MKNMLACSAACAALFCTGPALAQAGVKPLLTPPTEQITITQGSFAIGLALR